MTKQQETGTELALFPKLNLPSVTGITEEMNKSFGTMYTRIEAGIAELPTDMSIKANREKVASYAYSISRTKTGLDEAAAGVSSEAKQIVDAVNGERRQLKNTLDILRDKARERLDAWEAAEEARKIRVRDISMRLNNIEIELVGLSSDRLSDKWAEITGLFFDEADYGEDAKRLTEMQEQALTTINHEKENADRREAEAAELEQLRREKAEREAAEAARIAEEERKAAEAAEAQRQADERARLAQEAEEKAIAVKVKNATNLAFEFARLIDRAATAASGHIADYIETADGFKITDETFPAEKIGELCAAQAETVATLKDMAVTRAGEEQEAAERKIAERKEADRKAEIERQEQQKEAAARAEAQAKEREERAAAAERARIETEKANQEEAERARAADVAHRKKINGAAVKALVKALEVNETFAQQIVTAIYKGQIPHITINY